ncbi:hypothetical protein GCM10018965_037680 [Nonomuraea roseola]
MAVQVALAEGPVAFVVEPSGCSLTPSLVHTAPLASARWVTSPVPVRWTNSRRAASVSSPATPTNATWSYVAAAALTAGASERHLGHHGTQNQKTTGLPARLAPSKRCPFSVVAEKSRAEGTAAPGHAGTRIAESAAVSRPSSSSMPSAESARF